MSGKRQLIEWRLCIFAAMVVAVVNDSKAQEAPDPPERGVRHILEVTVKSDPNSHFLREDIGADVTATLTLKTRISDHSRESSFYGEVPTTISNFDPIKGSRVQIVWLDLKCHHERGTPKVTLVSVEGSAVSGQKKTPITARYRLIGKLLPGDEVLASRPINRGIDKAGPFIETRTETKESRLFVDMKLYILPCDLAVGAH